MLRHLRNYATSGIFIGLVGLITFPIIARNLSVSEYGILGLITASLTLAVAIGKLGVQHSVIRFYAQVKHGNISFSMDQLNSTLCLVFFCLASGTTLVWLGTGIWILPNIMQYDGIPSLFVLASGIVFTRLMGSGVINLLRSQQRSGDVAVIESLSRFLSLIFVVALFSLSSLSAWTILVTLLIAEIVAVSYAVYCYSSDFHFSVKDISRSLAKNVLIYGMPLMVLESLELVLRLSDRYMIESMIGAEALGQYTASYNFASYVDMIVLVAMIKALKPAYMQAWELEGREATQRFLSNYLRVFLIAGIPFFTMFAITAPHLLGILAGPKYLEGTVIIPYLSLGYILQGSVHILTAGLYIFQDSKVLVIWSCIATILNIGLNFIFIPKFGITGVAVVTLVSFSVFTVGVSTLAFRHISFPLELRLPVFMAVVSLVIFFLLHPLSFGTEIESFLGKGIVGTTVLLLSMWLLAPEVRFWLFTHYQKFVKKEVSL